MQILVAEDERINQLYMTHLLGGAGHEVTLANNGSDAIERLRAERVDLVFMDVQMPVLGGVEAVRSIRAGEAGADRAHVPIVALTAYTSADDHERYREAGFQDVATKPLDDALLLSLVDRYAPATENDVRMED
ncbi:MAG TPA: response regulator [Spirochaetia bacterium]|nr:response regulator [Spirochaetia bacterium]